MQHRCMHTHNHTQTHTRQPNEHMRGSSVHNKSRCDLENKVERKCITDNTDRGGFLLNGSMLNQTTQRQPHNESTRCVYKHRSQWEENSNILLLLWWRSGQMYTERDKYVLLEQKHLHLWFMFIINYVLFVYCFLFGKLSLFLCFSLYVVILFYPLK